MNANQIQPERALAGATLQSQSTPPRRILLVDDEPCIRQVNAGWLLGSGYEVDTAADGDAAWRSLNTNSYDLLITDNNMPKVTGVELLEKLHAAYMTLPVIMMSGAMPTEALRESPWLRVEAVLLKPFTSHELLGTVREVLHPGGSAAGQVEPPPIWRSQPSADGLRL